MDTMNPVPSDGIPLRNMGREEAPFNVEYDDLPAYREQAAEQEQLQQPLDPTDDGISPSVHDMDSSLLPAWTAFCRRMQPDLSLADTEKLLDIQNRTRLPWLVLTLPFPLGPDLDATFRQKTGATEEEVSLGLKVVGDAKIYHWPKRYDMPCKKALRLELRVPDWARGFGLEKILLDAVFTRLSQMAAEWEASQVYWRLWWSWFWSAPPLPPRYQVVQKGTEVLAFFRICQRCPDNEVDECPDNEVDELCDHNRMLSLLWSSSEFDFLTLWTPQPDKPDQVWVYLVRKVE